MEFQDKLKMKSNRKFFIKIIFLSLHIRKMLYKDIGLNFQNQKILILLKIETILF